MQEIKPGFYYHFKHDPKGSINDYAYEVLGVGKHTETEEYFVIYSPLYESEEKFRLRPLGMFLEEVEREGKVMPRFHKIEDPEIIAKLEEIKNKIYKI